LPAIYTRISFQNVYVDIYGFEHGDVVVNFYSDNACTQALSVTNLVVNYTVTWEFDNSTGSGNILANGSSGTIASNTLLSAPDPSCNPTIPVQQFCIPYNYDYTLTIGNYFIK